MGWARQGGSREPEHKAFSGVKHCSGSSGQELQAGSHQPEHSAVAYAGEGARLGGFLAGAGSQATGRWSPPWASAQVEAFIECLVCARHRGRAIDQITPTLGTGPKSSW